jgi:hypothetical protein
MSFGDRLLARNLAVGSTAEHPTNETVRAAAPEELVPADYFDPVIEAYKKDVDRTLLGENLKLPVEQRQQKADSFHEAVEGWREAGRRARRERIPRDDI